MSTFAWRGFERAPEGALLEQRVDLRGDVGIAYERSVHFSKPDHVHDRPMLVCPRGSCRMSVGVADDRRWPVDATRVLWVPEGVVHDNECASVVYDTFALYPSKAFVSQRASSVQRRELDRQCALTRRSPWLDDLVDRYFTLRVVQRSRAGARFFEEQIIDELLRLRFAPRERPSVPVLDRGGIAEAALRYIESNLFSELRIEELACHVQTSVATLLRRFRAAYGQTPYAYARRRRLDESRGLIARGDHSITDIALIVGYEDVSSFSKAFRAQFGVPPSRG